MKALVCDRYGSPEVLKLEEVVKPVPKDDEVLIKVRAASVNSWDWDLLRGKPWIIRTGGMRKPQYRILGADVAGQVEAVGQNVTRFRPGDEVFGDLCESGWGGFAEYTCAREKALTLKPAGMSFEEAAATPQAAVLALQGLRHTRPVQPAQKILINGAGGGVGTFALQMAKLWGAEVSCVDRTDKLEFLQSWGADHVIDYTREDYTKTGKHYDLILDVVARHSIFDYRRTLNPGGVFVVIGGSMSTIFQTAFPGSLLSVMGNKKLKLLLHKPNKDLEFIKELFEAGKLKPVIDRVYPLSDTAEAVRQLGKGNVKGKMVVTI